jgi:prophage DNA circulation protein
MTWRAKQAPAKFRGVPFFVDGGERTGGRQAVVHEFPFSESAPYTEDLGMKGRGFTVDGYVIGAEYEAARDALLKALETPGPGELVHPYFGTRRVAVVTFRVSQRRTEGGFASFSIDFRETATKPENPSSTVDAKATLANKVKAAREGTKTSHVNTHTKQAYGGDLDLPSREQALVISAVAAMTETIERLPVDPQFHAAFSRFLEHSPEVSFSLVSEYVAAVFDTIFDTLTAALLTVTGPIDVSGAILAIYDFDPGTRPSAITPARALEQADFDSLHHLVQRLAISYASSAAAVQTFTSYEEAVRVRAAITDRIDQHVEGVTDDSYPFLSDLRGALVEALPGPDTDLPRIQTYTPPAVVPSLVLAHRLYGSLEREEDLIRRNRIRHPGFIAGELEVLTDG